MIDLDDDDLDDDDADDDQDEFDDDDDGDDEDDDEDVDEETWQVSLELNRAQQDPLWLDGPRKKSRYGLTSG